MVLCLWLCNESSPRSNSHWDVSHVLVLEVFRATRLIMELLSVTFHLSYLHSTNCLVFLQFHISQLCYCHFAKSTCTVMWQRYLMKYFFTHPDKEGEKGNILIVQADRQKIFHWAVTRIILILNYARSLDLIKYETNNPHGLLYWS